MDRDKCVELQRLFAIYGANFFAESSSFGVSVSVSAEFGIPDIGGVSTSVSTSTEFNNSVSQGYDGLQFS